MRMVMLLVMVVALAAPRADACGGLFCSSSSPTPVDQNAERILFEVHEDGSVTATVEINYTGTPDAFSWIVPIPDEPDLIEVASSASVLQLLDAATRPVAAPTPTTCSNPSSPPPSLGCGPDFLAIGDGSPNGRGGDGVSVRNYASVGPFDGIVVVTGQDPQALSQYLTDAGYLVTDAMRPFIAQYTTESQSFLALKLAPDAETQDIVPLRFHCPAENPTIPLRLTAIAALPEMGIMTFIAAAGRYEPVAPFQEVIINGLDTRVVGPGNNYFPLVSKRIDEAGGHAFVAEYAGATSTARSLVDNTFLGLADELEAREEIAALFDRRPYLTRLYTRMHPEEMTVDPQFRPSTAGDVSNAIDSSLVPPIDNCPGDGVAVVQPPACSFTYCGAHGACGTAATNVDGFTPEGCACELGYVARAIPDLASSPFGVGNNSGGNTVTCQLASLSVLGDNLNPCGGIDCGEGSCSAINGAATCFCRQGFIGVPDANAGAGVMCVASTAVYSSDRIIWPTDPAGQAQAGGCSSGRRAGGLLSLSLMFIAALLVRRRR